MSGANSDQCLAPQQDDYMITTNRKPFTVGQILATEFLQPLGLTQKRLSELMSVPRRHINELCNDRRSITADTALMLARVFSNSPGFWLNLQRRSDLWEAMHSPERLERIARARPMYLKEAGRLNALASLKLQQSDLLGEIPLGCTVKQQPESARNN